MKILEPLGLGDVEDLSDERGEAGVTLINPAAGGNLGSYFRVVVCKGSKVFTSVCNVPELAAPEELDKVLADGGFQELRVKFGNTIDLARAYDVREKSARKREARKNGKAYR